MKFNYLKLDGKIYFKPEGQYSEVPSFLLFDGVVPGNTYLSYWKVVNAIPQRVCKKPYTKSKYMLKEGMPEGMDKELRGLPDDSLQPCYDKVSWEVPEEDIEVEWVCLGEYNLTPCQPLKNLQTPTPVKLTVPEIAHQAFPCSLDSQDSFNVIREYVKQNIDLKWASITSDYDFCLTVKKVIPYYEPTKKLVNNRATTIFECAPKTHKGVHEGYTQCPSFSGNTHQELLDNIDNYLQGLIKIINEPLVDCPHCKGTGVCNV